MTAFDSLRVELGTRSYNIIIGPGVIAESGAQIAPVLRQDRVFVVTDETVGARHLAPLQDSLCAQGIATQCLALPPGEGTKSFASLEKVIDWMLSCGVDRQSTVLAFGGGVIGDLAGFVAASVLRGIDFIQIPTTLLAQVDSSVGGKTGLNTPRGKNLVGAFHQPRLVLADTTVLQSLPRRQLLAGYVEVVKYGLIRDLEFFLWLENNADDLLNGEAKALSRAIHDSCKTKAAIVAEDEREHGTRALLNLGHTFGHALEAEAGYNGTLLHGEAVAIGIVMALDFSASRGQISPQDAGRVRGHLDRLGLPTTPRFLAEKLSCSLNPVRLKAQMLRDKKTTDGQIALVLLNALGAAHLEHAVDHAELTAFLHNACA